MPPIIYHGNYIYLSEYIEITFFSGNNPIVLLYNIYELLYMYINWFVCLIFLMIVYVIQKKG